MHDLQIDFNFKIDLNLILIRLRFILSNYSLMFFKQVNDKQTDWRACFFSENVPKVFKSSKIERKSSSCIVSLFSTYFAYFLLIETTFAAEEIIILSHTESTLTTDSAKVFG